MTENIPLYYTATIVGVSMDSEEKNLKTVDVTGDSADIILDSEKTGYEYTAELELVISTRDNFLTWKDYDY